MKDDYETIVSKIANAYKSVYGEDLKSVLVYGSYARGDQNDFSDIDMVAIVKGDRLHLQQLLKQVWNISSELELEYETILSPTVIPYDEFRKYQNDIPYYKNIAEEGIPVNVQ